MAAMELLVLEEKNSLIEGVPMVAMVAMAVELFFKAILILTLF
jgi:hypothetical protein